jgi:hypothetical protein
MKNNIDFRKFNHTDDCFLNMDKFRHLAYYNLSGGLYKHEVCLWKNNIKVFTPYFKKIKNANKKQLGFEINTEKQKALIKVIEDYFNLKNQRISAINRRREANKNVNKVRSVIYKRDGHACLKCGSVEKLTIDHIIPITKGGTDFISNLQTLCLFCNISKSNRI